MAGRFYIKTPVFSSHQLKKEQGYNVFYKMDCHQPTGSFKIRGMEALCLFHLKEGRNNFIGSSGGNAGYSLAYIGQQVNANVKIVVPKTTSKRMVKMIGYLGAEVEIFGEVWDEAHNYALEIAQKKDCVYVSPFDDPLLWNGHSTIIDEAAKQMENLIK